MAACYCGERDEHQHPSRRRMPQRRVVSEPAFVAVRGHLWQCHRVSEVTADRPSLFFTCEVVPST